MSAHARKWVTGFACMALLSSNARAADKSLSILPISDSIYQITHTGSFETNLIVNIGDDGVLLIDHLYTRNNLILDAVEEISAAPIKFAINTHWHPDHTDGNVWFDEDTVIISHRETRNRRNAVQAAPWAPEGHPALSPSALPDVVFDDSMSLFFNGEEIRLIALPRGHTDGDILVLFETSKIAVTGDAFNGRGK